jgi:integrase/recombinase XerC
VAALRCLYRRAVEDGLISEADDPARKVPEPRRLPSTRRAVPETRLAEINQIAATTGDDPELDTLLLRLHTETACRRGGAQDRHAPPGGQLLRYADGRPITSRRYDHLWTRIGPAS